MTDAPETCPVHDWASDYDIFDPDYVRDPAPVWDDLRERCPIAHTTRWGGSWLPTRYEDLQQMVKMVPALSSRSSVVVPPPRRNCGKSWWPKPRNTAARARRSPPTRRSTCPSDG